MNSLNSSGFSLIDGLIIFVYLGTLMGIGFYFSRKQKTLDDYFKSGKQLGWLSVGISLMAALNSGLDYINTPAVVFGIGMITVMSFLSWIPLYPWVTRVTIPMYRRLDVFSAYEYLELRFDLAVRAVGSGIFILWRIGWMGAALYVPCLAVKAATGGQLDIFWMIILLGSLVTIYTMLGGMKAVIWTDVTQFFVMFTGLFATLYFIISNTPGGVSEVYRFAQESGRIDLIADIPEMQGASMMEKIRLYLTEELTLVGVVLVVTIGRCAAFTADQIAILRFQAMRSIKEARKSYLINAVSDTVWMVFLGFVGLALFAFYQHAEYPQGIQNDHILPYFMANHFPVGLTGLVIAAIFAASLSSVDAALNSTTSVIVVDYYNRLYLGKVRPAENLTAEEERKQILVARIATLCIGGVMILVASNVGRMGELYAAANRIIGSFFGPLFGIFVLGMFSSKSHSIGVVIGALAGLTTSIYVAFFSEFSWVWPSPLGISATLIVGYLASLIIPKKAVDKPPLTFKEVMKLPEPD